ncbi:hypothetical protein BO71DRAFT_345453 [Aspergillus ellipticus CBS 707.79]|uniref:Fungal N-terminal domain-containing protein n=1 Tax=Aspergillus ellipticus CBS 707.79 TaxID=1448320 RepID=A0A319DLB3_9EURO|nr:hypothetical protein BO71DRAFT_345453 [Aspergillus ellipticus CBS 707.79]
MSLPQVGLGDLITAARIIWTVYESIASGPKGATRDFNSFCDEFRSVKGLLERLEQVKGPSSSDAFDLGVIYDETIQECTEFVEKHKKLAQNGSSSSSNRLHGLGTKMSIFFEKSTWSLECDEAERLRRKLERCLKIATLKSTEETRVAALKIIREAEHSRLENLEMLKSIKTMTAQISSLLRWCILEGPAEVDALHTMHHMSHLHYRSRPALIEPGHELRAIPENEELFMFERQGDLEVLDRIRETSERLDNLMRRLNTHESAGRTMERHRPPGRAYTLDSVSDGASTVDPMVELLHQASDDVRDALESVGYRNDFVPNHDPSRTHQHQHSRPNSQLINEAAEEWEQFRQWLDFQFVHTFNSASDNFDSLHSLSRMPSSPSFTPSSPDACLPEISLSRISSKESDLDSIGSPLHGTNMFVPDRRVQLTEHPVQVEFPHPDIPHRAAFRTLTCTVTAIFSAQTHEPGVIEAVDIQSGVKVTHRILHQSSKVESAMIPYIPSSRVTRSFPEVYTIWFQGSHRTKIEEEQSSTRLRVPPIYKCQDRKDFSSFQNTFLKRRVTCCIDVKTISLNTGECHCNSAETVRILEDPVTKGLSLLYFASFPGTGRRARFIDTPVTDFSKPEAKSKHVKLPFQSISRRSSIGSATSVLSQESRLSVSSRTSLSTSPGSGRREKYLELEFYETKDCAAFLKALKRREEEH